MLITLSVMVGEVWLCSLLIGCDLPPSSVIIIQGKKHNAVMFDHLVKQPQMLLVSFPSSPRITVWLMR